MWKKNKLPLRQGLYDPSFEHDACGIGFVANVKGVKTNKILRQGLSILVNLDHRGGQGSETNTGDGAGILIQIPHNFLASECKKLGFSLPAEESYGVGMIFLPENNEVRRKYKKALAEVIAAEGQKLLGWREVPTDDSTLGKTAKSAKPFVEQVFIEKSLDIKDRISFERKLFAIRKKIERYHNSEKNGSFYIVSLSATTIVYKGMLTPEQLDKFYLDLKDPGLETALALVHSRFSTNTFPSWERAHPYRYMIHNGEINTLRGNVNWMNARQSICKSKYFGDNLDEIMPVLEPDGSDSSTFDNCLEFLYLNGRSLPHAAMMMVPEPWANHTSMDEDRKAFYEYHSCLMEPWDGPAAIAFTDGRIIGAQLDRNGLRPARYYLTTDDMIIMSSEVGVLEIEDSKILSKERLHPGRILLVDLVKGRITTDEVLKKNISRENPYKKWLAENLLTMEDLPLDFEASYAEMSSVHEKQKTFGYTYEELNKLLAPMALEAMEPVDAMGYDSPLAVLSERPQLLYNYFKQLFAQVTNPPIDAIREELITSTLTTVGAEGNLLDPRPESCRLLRMKTPILNNEELSRIKALTKEGFKCQTISTLFNVSKEAGEIEKALLKICDEASLAIDKGVSIIILSDRGVDKEKAPIPALLVVSCLHHYLIRAGKRTKVGFIVESGEPRESHHFALLLGYGASGINPYLSLESLADMHDKGLIDGLTKEEAENNYIKAGTKGIVKILSKMGISTIQSYRGAQIFEAIGIHPDVIEKYFTGTPSRLGGIDISIIEKESLARHSSAFSDRGDTASDLESGSDFQWRKDGEHHMFNPGTIYTLQRACRESNYSLYKEYSNHLNNEAPINTIRSMLRFKDDLDPVPLEQVESVESICRRFKSGAISYGSISKESHECIAIAMNRIGGKSNTGEGGEDVDRFLPDPNGDSRRSAIKQVASGRFGVTSNYLVNADEIQIKMAQGAKPGEGGQLPGKKVYPWIAKVRNSTPGVSLISPPPHHDIYSIEDLAQLIHDLKNANHKARINVKLVSEVGVGTVATGVAKSRADVVLISGYDGGTGASPRSSIKHAGLPWELGLAETHQTLVLNNLRDRIVVETDGKMMTGRDVVIAALLGAEEYGFATAPMVVLGCVMMRVCSLDTCPAGIATQNPELRKKFAGKPEHLVNYMRFVAQEIREIMAELGFRTIDEMVGRTDVLEKDSAKDHWKTENLNLDSVLYEPDLSADKARFCQIEQDHGLEKSLDMRELLDICQPAIDNAEPVTAMLSIKNTDRVAGTILGSEVSRKYGAKGLPDGTIRLNFKGSAGQSFGAFVPPGITLSLAGDANDYLGKGLSGGRLIVAPTKEATFKPEENILVGNVVLYGATSGETYIRGVAGERFCVRFSGGSAVVEGVGDHGCEYMTGGRVAILGATGRNFAAGMSGGIAYVLDEKGDFYNNCNKEMVLLESLNDWYEIEALKEMIEKHYQYTGSVVAEKVLVDWDKNICRFIKIIPKDYKRMITAIEKVKEQGLCEEDAAMVAFEKNVRSVALSTGR